MGKRGLWPTILGLVIIIIGVVGLLNTLGLIALTAGEVFGFFFTLGLIALGVWLILRARRPLAVPRDISVLFGDTTIGRQPWELRELNVHTGVGDVRVDLTTAIVPEREGLVRISATVGNVRVIVPPDLAAEARGAIWLGSIELFGRRAEGFARELDFIADDFEIAERRVVIDVSLALGEARLYRAA